MYDCPTCGGGPGNVYGCLCHRLPKPPENTMPKTRWTNREPPLSPEDDDERSEEEIRKDEEAREAQEISDWEDRQNDPYDR